MCINPAMNHLDTRHVTHRQMFTRTQLHSALWMHQGPSKVMVSNDACENQLLLIM